ncbi:MAG: MFS transporter [Gammaproteobacteria bacterium]|nr:MFS transporter [Gammaproteobacteria bacterium]
MDSQGGEHSFRGPPLRAAVLCCLFMVMQGVDTFGISYVAPLLGADFGIAPAQIGLVFAASVIASLVGAIGIAPLSDRFGRRRVLLVAVLLTGAPSLFIPLTRDMSMLVVLRVIVGLGFGAALPVALALVSDFAPARFRSRLVTLTTTAIVVGMSLSGLAASLMVPRFGWPWLLYASGAASMVAVMLGFLLLPESRPAPRRDSPSPLPPSALRTLLQPAVLLRSALFGVVLTMSYIVLNFAVYWLPTVIYNEGYSVGDAGLIGSTRQLLTVALGFVVGFTMDRLGANRVLVVCHAAAMVLFMLVGGMSIFAALSLAVLLLGMSVLSAGLSGLLALVSASYDASVRATALGWVQGLSRVVGGSIGTYMGGVLLGAGWAQQQLALAAGLAAAVGLTALVAAVSLGRGAAVTTGTCK